MLIVLSYDSHPHWLTDLRKDSTSDAALTALAKSRGFVDGLEELGSCRYKGNHQLAGPPILLTRLAETGGLSDRARQGLRDAGRWSQTALAKARNVSPRVEIVAAVSGKNPDRSVFEIPWLALAEQDWLNMATIGGENIDDARYFRCVALAWHAWAKLALTSILLPDGAIRLDVEGLGGSTAGAFAEGHLKARRSLLVIVDSDRSHPAASLGQTARDAEKHWDNCWVTSAPPRTPFRVEVLPAHAAENLLPAALVERVAGERGAPDKDVVQLNVASGFFCRPEGVDPHLRYLHISAKDSCPHRLLAVADAGAASYRKAAVDRIAAARRESGLAADPTTRQPSCAIDCSTEPPPTADCVWVRSVGKKLLPAVAACAETIIKNEGAHALANHLPFGRDNEWDALAQLIATWGLGHRMSFA